jgi:hypothetical protein
MVNLKWKCKVKHQGEGILETRGRDKADNEVGLYFLRECRPRPMSSLYPS